MHIDPRRLTAQTFGIGSSLAWGVVELIALARMRWGSRKQRKHL